MRENCFSPFVQFVLDMVSIAALGMFEPKLGQKDEYIICTHNWQAQNKLYEPLPPS